MQVQGQILPGGVHLSCVVSVKYRLYCVDIVYELVALQIVCRVKQKLWMSTAGLLSFKTKII